MGEKICNMYTIRQGFVCKIDKEFRKINEKKTIKIKTGQQD